MKLVRIKFPAVFFDGETSRVAVADFKLGLGRCGKTVRGFLVATNDQTYTIVQEHTDDTFKRFSYRWEDIRGRIEEEYAEDGSR